MARCGHSIRVFLVAITLATFAAPLMAQTDERVQQLENRLDELLRQAAEIRQELDALKGTPTTPEAPTTVAPDLTQVDVVSDAGAPIAAAAAKALNPDISVIGTMVGHALDQNPLEESRPFQFQEAEIAMEAFVDPYMKGRFFIALENGEIDLEEGYAQFVALPYGLTAKAGKTKALFGKANTWHTHVRPWVDQPLMVTNLFGEEGLASTGVSVSKSIANPWNAFIEVTGEVFSADFDANDLFYNAHLKVFRDLTENSNVEVGTSWAQGGMESPTNRLAGVDVTYRWKPLQRSIYNSLRVRFEGVASRPTDSDRTLYGFYTSADYQLARRWFAGVRVDRADRDFEERFTDRGVSATLTFWPSEFSQIRGQFRRTSYGSIDTVNEFLIQLQFAIGAHGAHVF